jgi:hypothetical protein
MNTKVVVLRLSELADYVCVCVRAREFSILRKQSMV